MSLIHNNAGEGLRVGQPVTPLEIDGINGRFLLATGVLAFSVVAAACVPGGVDAYDPDGSPGRVKPLDINITPTPTAAFVLPGGGGGDVSNVKPEVVKTVQAQIPGEGKLDETGKSGNEEQIGFSTETVNVAELNPNLHWFLVSDEEGTYRREMDGKYKITRDDKGRIVRAQDGNGEMKAVVLFDKGEEIFGPEGMKVSERGGTVLTELPVINTGIVRESFEIMAGETTYVVGGVEVVARPVYVVNGVEVLVSTTSPEEFKKAVAPVSVRLKYSLEDDPDLWPGHPSKVNDKEFKVLSNLETRAILTSAVTINQVLMFEVVGAPDSMERPDISNMKDQIELRKAALYDLKRFSVLNNSSEDGGDLLGVTFGILSAVGQK